MEVSINNAERLGFSVAGDPDRRGRVIQPREEVKPVKQQGPDLTKVLEKLSAIEEQLKENVVVVPEVTNGVNNIPFNPKKQRAMLEGIALYLQAQLAAVNKRIKQLNDEEMSNENEN